MSTECPPEKAEEVETADAISAGSLKTVAVAGPAYLGETKRQPEQERGSSMLALAYLAPLDDSRAAVRQSGPVYGGPLVTHQPPK